MSNIKKKFNSYSTVQLFNCSTKGGFTIVEVVFVFFLILGVVFFIAPKSFENTQQAKLISQWAQKYSDLEYMFSVIKAQQEGELNKKFKSASSDDARQLVLLNAIKPYLRVTKEVEGDYTQHYMNKDKVENGSRYYFDKFYMSNSNEIIGLKWFDGECQENKICAIITFDINGLTPPNAWGYDIFGINILKNEIQPIGRESDSDTLRKNCDKNNYGTYCSYYYLIGGRFD